MIGDLVTTLSDCTPQLAIGRCPLPAVMPFNPAFFPTIAPRRVLRRGKISLESGHPRGHCVLSVKKVGFALSKMYVGQGWSYSSAPPACASEDWLIGSSECFSSDLLGIRERKCGKRRQALPCHVDLDAVKAGRNAPSPWGSNLVNGVVQARAILTTTKGELFCLGPPTRIGMWHNPHKDFGTRLATIATEHNAGGGNTSVLADKSCRGEQAAASGAAVAAAVASS